MHPTFTFGTVRGIRISANWSLIVVGWLIAWSLASEQLPLDAPGYSTTAYWLVGSLAACVFFASLLLHELAHSLVARRSGVQVEGIVLWLFGGVSQFSGDSPTAGDELAMAVAGPLTSVAIGAGFIALRFVLAAVGAPHLVVAGAAWLGWINLLLAAFNMAPAFPLDGGRVLRAWLWRRHGDKQRATISATRFGRYFAYVLIGLGLFEFAIGISVGGLWLVFLGWFLLAASAGEAAQSILHQQLEGLTAAHAMTSHPVVVPSNVTVEELMDGWLDVHPCSTFPLMSHDGTIDGLVTIRRLKSVPAGARHLTMVKEIAAVGADIARCPPSETLEVAIRLMNASPDQRVLVEDAGRLVGIISPSDVTRVISRLELGRGHIHEAEWRPHVRH